MKTTQAVIDKNRRVAVEFADKRAAAWAAAHAAGIMHPDLKPGRKPGRKPGIDANGNILCDEAIRHHKWMVRHGLLPADTSE